MFSMYHALHALRKKLIKLDTLHHLKISTSYKTQTGKPVGLFYEMHNGSQAMNQTFK